jgi:hypothetical protein
VARGAEEEAEEEGEVTERLADVVIDVGCADHGGDRSIVPLIEHYHPGLLMGFDPQLGDDWLPQETIGMTEVIRVQAAAWVEDAWLEMTGGGLGARMVPIEQGHSDVRAFDIAKIIPMFAGRIVLKLDAESAEWLIVPHLVEQDLDLRLDRILVEWHCVKCGNGAWSHSPPHPHGTVCDGAEETEARALAVEATVRCPIERWSL